MAHDPVLGHGGVQQGGGPVRAVRGGARESGRRALGVRRALVRPHRDPVQRPGRFRGPEERPGHRVTARPVCVRREDVVARHRPPGLRGHHVVRGARAEQLTARGERPGGLRHGSGGDHGDGRGGAGGGLVEQGLLRVGARQHEACCAGTHGDGALHAVAGAQHGAAGDERLTRVRDVPRAVPGLDGQLGERLGHGHGRGDRPRGRLGAPEVRHTRQPHESQTAHAEPRGGEAHGLVRPGLLDDPVGVRGEQRRAAHGELPGHEPRTGAGGRGGLRVQHGNPRLAEHAPHAASPQLLGEAAGEQVGVQVHGDRRPRIPRARGLLGQTRLAHLGGLGPDLRERLGDPARVGGEELPVRRRRRLPPAPRGAHDVRGEAQRVRIERVRAQQLGGTGLGPAAQHLGVPRAVHAGDVSVAAGQRGEVIGLDVRHSGRIAEDAPSRSLDHRTPPRAWLRNVASGFSSRPA